MKFQGRTVLITGSGTGIGRAIATRFAQEGASLIILGRRSGPLEDAAGDLNGIMARNNSGGTVRTFAGVDVADEAAVTGMFDELAGDGVTVDCVVNNAGVSGPVGCFVSAPRDEFDGTVGIHLTGTFWISVQALRVMRRGGKIITISTFFTEERPLEQRPYRFRSPYTASQGAKNRLAELMSWELVDRGITSIATNPGPVHSDRIYKTVYPKAAAEFMRVAGFEDMSPGEVAAATGRLLPLLGEDGETVRDGIAEAAADLAGGRDPAGLAGTLERLLAKVQAIAEKVQTNTSHMIANREFLSQDQVAESVLNLCDDDIAGILNGKVIPGDRVFYPVKPHVGAAPPGVHRQDLTGRSVVITLDGTDMADARRAEHLARHVEKCNGKAACFISDATPADVQEYVKDRVHSHVIDLRSPDEVARWIDTANAKLGRVRGVIHLTGRLPDVGPMTDIDRGAWDMLVAKFILTPAVVVQRALERFVPGGGEDPRKYKDSDGAVMIVGPDLPSGRKVGGAQRARVEVFRGALRPFTTTVNQELSDVLKSKARIMTVLPGSVTGAEPDDARIAGAFDFLMSGGAASSSEVTFCVDESR